MADKKKKEEREAYTLPDDPKEAMKQLKADRKQLKAERKAAAKEARLRMKEMEDAQAELTGESSGGLGAFLLVVLIILLWLLLMALLIKFDVAGLGETMRPILQDIPYLNNLLPYDEETATINESDTSENSVDSAYLTQLEKELANAQSENATLASTIETLNAEIERLEPFEEEQLQFEEDRNKFYEEIVYTDNAPDASAYASYYAMISPDAAASIYAQVVASEIDDEEVETYVAAFTAMEAKNAASIFDSMDDLTLVARILTQMSSDDRGAILEQMDVDIADKVTELMEPENLPNLNSASTGS